MSTEQIDQIFDYVQERCLWQFFSRSWDREENIEGILKVVGDMLAGKELSLETPMDRLFYADAKIMVADLRERCPWIDELGPAQLRDLLAQLKERLVDFNITKSLNQELTHTLY